MELLLILALNALAIFLLAVIWSGVFVKNFQTALLLGSILAILNTSVGPIVKIVSLPYYLLISIFSYFFLNMLFLILSDKLIDNFDMRNIKSVVLFSFILSVLNGGLQYLFYY